MYSAKDVRKSFQGDRYSRELETNLLGFLTYRQLSFFVTPVFVAASIHPTLVTLATLPMTLGIPIVALCVERDAYFWVALVGLLYHVLDYVDGNIARLTDKVSDLGRYLDSFIGNLYWVAVFVALGILADNEGRGVLPGRDNAGLVIGMAVAVIDLLGKQSRVYVRLYFGKATLKSGRTRHSISSSLASIVASLTVLMPVWLFGFGMFGYLRALLMFVAIHGILILGYVEYRIVRELVAGD